MIDIKEARRDPGLRALRVMRWLVLGGIWAMFTGSCVPIAIYTLPDIEAAWYPPIKDQRIFDVHMRPGYDDYLLWHWSFLGQRKRQSTYITMMAYSASTPQERYSVDLYIGWDCKRNFRSDRTTPPSTEVQTREVCIRLPPELVGKPDVRADGLFEFRVGHDFYTVPVRVPPDPKDWPDAEASGVRSIPVPIANP